MPPYRRRDLGHVDGPSERPPDEEYARYIWLVQEIKDARCDEARVYEAHPFLVKDVLFSAILVAANEALLRIGEIAGAAEGSGPRSRPGRSGAAPAYRLAGTPPPNCV